MKILVISCPISPEVSQRDGTLQAMLSIQHHLNKGNVEGIMSNLVEVPDGTKSYTVKIETSS